MKPVLEARRVAITGVGVLAACGIGRDAFWAGLLAPQPTAERRIADFEPEKFFDSPKEAKRTDRFAQIALAAAAEASRRSRPRSSRATKRVSGACRRSSCR